MAMMQTELERKGALLQVRAPLPLHPSPLF